MIGAIIEALVLTPPLLHFPLHSVQEQPKTHNKNDRFECLARIFRKFRIHSLTWGRHTQTDMLNKVSFFHCGLYFQFLRYLFSGENMFGQKALCPTSLSKSLRLPPSPRIIAHCTLHMCPAHGRHLHHWDESHLHVLRMPKKLPALHHLPVVSEVCGLPNRNLIDNMVPWSY